ncbi:NUDIX hydrolase [Candidatus Woesearchaeota archaeon]|nr:NUDIX hydrolase [Candidatus Woesearchaeota archaeon]
MVNPKIVTSAIIIKNDKVLLIKRKKYPEENKWALPGGLGSFKKFSDPQEAIKDEVRYDLNTDFKIRSFFNYSFYTGLEGPIITLHFTGTILEEPSINKEDIFAYEYFSKEEMPSREDMAFDHHLILTNFFKSVNSKMTSKDKCD